MAAPAQQQQNNVSATLTTKYPLNILVVAVHHVLWCPVVLEPVTSVVPLKWSHQKGHWQREELHHHCVVAVVAVVVFVCICCCIALVFAVLRFGFSTSCWKTNDKRREKKKLLIKISLSISSKKLRSTALISRSWKTREHSFARRLGGAPLKKVRFLAHEH